MGRIFILTTFLFAISAQAETSPTGDNAVFSLSMASLVCAAVQKVNPEAVGKLSDNYLKDSIKLYQFYHNNDYETAKNNQTSMFNLITGEAAIKAQSLRSVTGARAYIEKSLIKTDAKECSQIRYYAEKVLSHYGKSL
ncbi:hypothetical protein JYB88_05475 [Shewanella cyperi]|uniref:Uncharacterized protein n=1 Tax=Shewanella cyperi TaxID=2814292 RepID=A0A974XPL1_9GAMM|nr:hypothetical protein [Shewanella cyperi]QSX31093.1 hypothetical protein JYB88_05475 [Shewanella cyperi]